MFYKKKENESYPQPQKHHFTEPLVKIFTFTSPLTTPGICVRCDHECVCSLKNLTSLVLVYTGWI